MSQFKSSATPFILDPFLAIVKLLLFPLSKVMLIKSPIDGDSGKVAVTAPLVVLKMYPALEVNVCVLAAV